MHEAQFNFAIINATIVIVLGKYACNTFPIAWAKPVIVFLAGNSVPITMLVSETPGSKSVSMRFR